MTIQKIQNGPSFGSKILLKGNQKQVEKVLESITSSLGGTPVKCIDTKSGLGLSRYIVSGAQDVANLSESGLIPKSKFEQIVGRLQALDAKAILEAMKKGKFDPETFRLEI